MDGLDLAHPSHTLQETIVSGEYRWTAAAALGVVVALGVYGCSQNRPPVGGPPCSSTTTTTLCPQPTPTPPVPTPSPTPTPAPTPPPPSSCAKIIGPYNCSETAVPEYLDAVKNALQRITGGRTEVHYTEYIQQQILLQLMVDLDASGYCASYDLQAGNANAQASEMGVRLRVGGDHNSWLQVFASAGYVRWDGMFRSACSPLADEEMVSEVAAYWHLPVPPAFGPGPLGRKRRPGGPAR